MKKIAAIAMMVFLVSAGSIFAQGVSIDSSGNLTTGSANQNATLEVSGQTGSDGIIGTTRGAGTAVYGDNPDSGGHAGYFQGDARVTGNLTVDGTLTNPGLNADTVGGKQATEFMDKTTYDTNADGRVDSAVSADTATSAVTATTAQNADTVDGLHGAQLMEKASYDNNADGLVDDSDLLDGQHAADIISAAADEVRTAITACPTTINAPGSYYLTGNLSIANGNCITVTAGNVTIDLMGFVVTGGTTVPGAAGVFINGSINVEIRNGTVRGFVYGIYAQGGESIRVVKVRAEANSAGGISLLASNNLIMECTAADNAGIGIDVSSDSTVINNLVFNTNGSGVFAGDDSTVMKNTVNGNINGPGIFAGTGTTVMYNTVNGNGGSGIWTDNGSTVSNNTANSNGEWGVYAASGSRVMQNTMYSNTMGGMYVVTSNIVKSNVLDGNQQNNIYVAGPFNSIEENLVTGSVNGINFITPGNFYANNRAANNSGSDYAGNVPTLGGDGGGNAQF